MTYGSFDYTSLLYLSDYAEDFGGGRFVFMDEGSNKTIEPRAGKSLDLLAWSRPNCAHYYLGGLADTVGVGILCQ